MPESLLTVEELKVLILGAEERREEYLRESNADREKLRKMLEETRKANHPLEWLRRRWPGIVRKHTGPVDR